MERKKNSRSKITDVFSPNSSSFLNFLQVVYNLEINKWFVCWFLLMKKELSFDISMKLSLDSSMNQWILLEALVLKKY